MLEFLARQNVNPQLIRDIEAFRAQHPAPEDQIHRIPQPQLHFLGKQTWEQAATALLCGCNVLLSGPKATGKNVLAQDLAYAFGRPQWTVSFHIDVDASYLMGADTYANGQVEFRPGPVACCAQLGGFGVLDELNMARSEALAVMHATLDYRRIIDVPGYDLVQLDPACRFIGTMNVGYAGTRELNEALASRFVVVSVPVLHQDQLEELLAARFPNLSKKGKQQFAALFDEIRAKSAAGELSDRAVDLRGLLAAVQLVERGLNVRDALEICIANKTFDPYERGLVEDVIASRFSKSADATALFA